MCSMLAVSAKVPKLPKNKEAVFSQVHEPRKYSQGPTTPTRGIYLKVKTRGLILLLVKFKNYNLSLKFVAPEDRTFQKHIK